MNRTELVLRDMLRCSLSGSKVNSDIDSPGYLSDKEWMELSKLAGSQKVSALLYDTASAMNHIPEKVVMGFRTDAIKTAASDFRLLFLSRDILWTLNECGIPALLLKGMGTSGFYPSPLERKSGDVDILIPDNGLLERGVGVLEKRGLKVKEKQPALHHVVMSFENTIDVELHSLLAEPFDDDRINRILLRQQGRLMARSGSVNEPGCKEDNAAGRKADNDAWHEPWHGAGHSQKNELSADEDLVINRSVLGVDLKMLGDAFHAYELLLHMLQHYLRSGFGIRLLCDWVAFWNREIPEHTVRKYLKLVKESGIKGFSDMITLVCYRHLGLCKKSVKLLTAGDRRYTRSETDAYWEDFLRSGEFGKVSKDRMVALRGSGILDYAREFHHQMKLNYPEACRRVPLWPVLWCLTFARFMINNKKIRKVSLKSVLISAGRRGDMVKKLQLFSRRS